MVASALLQTLLATATPRLAVGRTSGGTVGIPALGAWLALPPGTALPALFTSVAALAALGLALTWEPT